MGERRYGIKEERGRAREIREKEKKEKREAILTYRRDPVYNRRGQRRWWDGKRQRQKK